MVARRMEADRPLQAIKESVAKKRERVLDSVYGISKKLNVSTFQTLPAGAGKFYEAIPGLTRESASRAIIDWFDKIPKTRKIQVGSDIYNRVLRFRQRLIGAEEGVHEGPYGPISYFETKQRDKETVVFFHGFADTKDNLLDLCQHLVPDYHFLAPDIPGFGKSFKDDSKEYNLPSMVSWLKEFLDAKGIKKFHLIGHSMGGGIALEFALKYPEMVHSLSLMCCAGIHSPGYESIYDDIISGEILFQIETMDEFEEFLERAFHKVPFVPPFVKEFYFNQFLDNYEWYGDIVRHTFDESIRDQSAPEFKEKLFNHRLSEIKIPTQMIWGEFDRLFPKEFALDAHKQLPSCDLKIIKGVGHSPHYESPKEVSNIIQNFLKSRPM